MMKTLAFLIPLTVLAGEVWCQDTSTRARIEVFREELAAMEMSGWGELVARESLTVERARLNRDDPMVHMELGFINYRMAELADSPDSYYEAAAGEFEWARDLRPEWPYANYGLGLAELGLGEHGMIAVENIRQIFGIDHLSKAAKAFAAAAESDPSFVQAVLDLAAAADRQRIQPRLEVALEALQRAARTEAGLNPALQLALGRMSRDLGLTDSATIAFRRYLQVGGDSAVGFLEVARTDFVLGRIRTAQQLYYEGAERAVNSPEAVGLYRYDVNWLGTANEIEEFDELAGAGMHLWLQTFWERREAIDLRRPGERMAEHFRRFFYARSNYRLLSAHRHYDITERYRSDQDEVDDRGVIYIRHGPPDRVASYNAPGVEPNESWEYGWPDGQRIFHFVARDDVSDYKLVESLIDVYGFGGAMVLRTDLGVGYVDRELFASRGNFNSRYRRLSTAGSASVSSDLANEREAGARAVVLGTTTDSYVQRFGGSVEPEVQRAVVAAEPGLPGVLLISWAVEGSNLEALQAPSGLRYSLDVRVSAMLNGNRQVAFLDTAFTYPVTRRLNRGQYLQEMVYMELDPGTYVVRLMVQDAVSGAGTITTLDTVFVPGNRLSEPVVGDLVAGYEGWGLRWSMGEESIYMNPTGLYPLGSVMDVHYEIYGLERGLEYEAKIEVEKGGGGGVLGFVGRLFGGGGTKISLEFPGVSRGTVTSVNQTVDLEPLEAGDYRVRLTVNVGDGREVTRETTIIVLGGDA